MTMIDRLRDVATAIFLEVVGWLAFPLAPIAVALAHRDNFPSAGGWDSGADVPRGYLQWPFCWLDTPDEPLPGGMYEPAVKSFYHAYGWYWSAVFWLWRNRAFALAFHFGRPAKDYADAPWRVDWTFWFLRGMIGWKVYRATPREKPLIAVPAISIRINK